MFGTVRGFSLLPKTRQKPLRKSSNLCVESLSYVCEVSTSALEICKPIRSSVRMVLETPMIATADLRSLIGIVFQNALKIDMFVLLMFTLPSSLIAAQPVEMSTS